MRIGWAGRIAGAVIVLSLAIAACDPAAGGPSSSPVPAPAKERP